MPSQSPKQHRFMEAIAHGWHPTGKPGPTKAVAEDFVAADKSAGRYQSHSGTDWHKANQKGKLHG